MQYSITIDLVERIAIITRYTTGRLGPSRTENYHCLTRSSARRIFCLCQTLTPLKINKLRGFYHFARLGESAEV